MPREFHFPSRVEERARELVDEAEAGCLVAVSLDLPLHTEIDVAVVAPV